MNLPYYFKLDFEKYLIEKANYDYELMQKIRNIQDIFKKENEDYLKTYLFDFLGVNYDDVLKKAEASYKRTITNELKKAIDNY